ncbi:MAG: hypothetical protein R6V62_10040 [Candidatus Fermentibacteraceae bacterium]
MTLISIGEPMTDRPAGFAVCLAAVALMAVLSALSFQKSLTGDEALTVALARGAFTQMVDTVARESHVPGYHVLLWLWIRAFGASLPVLRLFAFIPVGILVFLGCRRFPPYGYLVLATSPFLLHLAVELRMYGLLALVGMGILLALKALARKFTTAGFVALAAACVAGVWTLHFAWLAVAAAMVVLFRLKRRFHALILAALVLAAFSPWAPNMVRQFHRFSPGGESGDFQMFELASPTQRVLGAPFSMAGTLLRFAAGNGAFRFSLFSLGTLSLWVVSGFLLLGLMLLSAFLGRRYPGFGGIILFLFILVPVSFLRPSARHFSLAYPVFAAMVAAGISGAGALRRVLRVFVPVLSLVMCVPFVTRSTLPQRCTFDRDFREAARIAGEAALSGNGRLVAYLDTHSLLCVQYHLDEQGFSEVELIHPHMERHTSGWLIYFEPEDLVAYLLCNTDSLVGTWGTDFILLANDPRLARGPLFGTGNTLIGRGSDMIADVDLMDCLEKRYTLERIALPRSQGPLSLFRVTVSGEQQGSL